MHSDNKEPYNAFYLKMEPDYYLFNGSRGRTLSEVCSISQGEKNTTYGALMLPSCWVSDAPKLHMQTNETTSKWNMGPWRPLTFRAYMYIYMS